MNLFALGQRSSAPDVQKPQIFLAQTHKLHPLARVGAIAFFGLGVTSCSQTSIQPLTAPQKTVANLAINHIQTLDSTQLSNFEHKPLVMKDAVPPNSDFDQFRAQLRQAVETRDMSFIEPLIPSYGVRIGIGLPFTLQELQIEDTNAMLWRTLEKSLGAGCQQEPQANYNSIDANSTVWVCPNVASEFYQQYPPASDRDRMPHGLAHVVVIGSDIKLHAEPSADSKVIALLNNEVVKFDYQAWNRLTDDEKVVYLDGLEGWTPVFLPDSRSGFVMNRYAYRPLDLRVVFGQIGQEWKILDIPRGDS